MWFALGDCLAGMLVGVVTALAVHAVVAPGMDMVIAMLIGMAFGMIVHMVLGLAVAPLLGMFQTMVPASLIGMYGGMMFGMRDSMGAGPYGYGGVALVGAIFGLVVVASVRIYDRVLSSTVVDMAE